jgi:L-lactate dehydrogenase complex protein LldE
MLISLFIACYNDTLFPETGKAVVKVLERLGHTVEFRQAQTCCGQMHYNTGYHPEAVTIMRHFLEVFKGAEVICVPSASCVAMMRDHYPKMTAGDAALEAAVAEVLPCVFEFTELLVDKLKVTDVGATYPHTVTLHTPCLIPLPNADQCCGFGGTFAIKNAEVSSAMLNEKMAAIASTGATICTAGDNSCLMHIEGGLSRNKAAAHCVHIAEILAAHEGAS